MTLTERPTTSEGGEDGRLALVYEESRRALDAQAASLDNLRTRTGVLIAATAVVSTFLGGQALRSSDPTLWSWVAIGALFVAGLAATAVLFPLGKWKFTSNVDTLLDGYVEHETPASLDEMHRDLAKWNQVNRRANEGKLKKLFFGFQVACAAFVLEVVFWLIDLALRAS